MEDLNKNISYLRKQIEETYKGYEKILSDCKKSALTELYHLHDEEVKKIQSQSTDTVGSAGMELSYDKYDKSKSIKYKTYTWNSDLGKFSGFLKTSFGFFSSRVLTKN